MKTYYEVASDLAEVAPAQARLLRYLLVQDEMQDIGAITEALDFTPSNFRILVGKLRDRGVEVVCRRVGPKTDPEYLYGVRTTEVETWSEERRKAVLTAWDRTARVFERHLLALELEPMEVGKIIGALEMTTSQIKAISLDISRREGERAQAQARAKAEAEAERDHEHI